MLPNLHRKPSASQPFKLLVGHKGRASDPSRGYNAPSLRYGFDTQLITTARGTGYFAIFDGYLPTLIIKVNSNAYANHLLDDAGDPVVGGAGDPIDGQLEPDLFQIYSDNMGELEILGAIQVGDSFGRAQGNGFGTLADIATSLAGALNDARMNFTAIVDPDDDTQVKVTSLTILDDIIVQISSFTYDIWGGDSPFIIKDGDGNILFDGTAEKLLGKKVVFKDHGTSPISEITTATLNNEFGNFLRDSLNFPITKAKSTLTKIHMAYMYNNDILISYDPSANTDAAKNHITIENTVNSNTDTLRFTGSNKYDNAGALLYTFGTLEGNKWNIKSFVNAFLVAEGYDPIN
jgi:hypothetical protein